MRDRSAPPGFFFLLSPLVVYGFYGAKLGLLEEVLVRVGSCGREREWWGKKEERGRENWLELVEILIFFLLFILFNSKL